MKCFIVLSIILAVAYGADVYDPEVELPSEMVICSRDDPKRDECIKNSIQKFLPSLHKGIPQLDFESLDPYVIDNTVFNFKSDQYSGTLSVKSGKSYGLSRATIKDVRSEITDDTMKLDVDIFIPRIFIEGNYKGNGQLNTLRLESKGLFNVSMKNIETTWKMKGSLVDVNGEKYMKIVSFGLVPKVGAMKLYAQGLFPDPQLNRVAVDLINQYWPLFYAEMLPTTQDQWEPMLIAIANKVFLRVPFRRLFPTA